MNFGDQGVLQGRIVQFGYGSAFLADHQNAVRTMRQIVASRKGVDRFDSMSQARGKQEVECAVDGWRRRPGMGLFHFVEERIRFGGSTGVQEQFEHFAANWRQPFAAIAAILFSECKRRLDLRGQYGFAHGNSAPK